MRVALVAVALLVACSKRVPDQSVAPAPSSSAPQVEDKLTVRSVAPPVPTRPYGHTRSWELTSARDRPVELELVDRNELAKDSPPEKRLIATTLGLLADRPRTLVAEWWSQAGDGGASAGLTVTLDGAPLASVEVPSARLSKNATYGVTAIGDHLAIPAGKWQHLLLATPSSAEGVMLEPELRLLSSGKWIEAPLFPDGVFVLRVRVS